MILDKNGQPLSSPSADMETANNNWWQWADKWADGVVNPDKVPLSKYSKMMDQDETVFSGLEYMKMSVLSRIGDYNHEDPQVEQFVRDNLEQMDGNILRQMAEMLSSRPYGFSATEILWRPGPEGRVHLKGLQTLHPESVNLEIWREGPDKNKLKHVMQWWRMGDPEVIIPPEKLIMLANRPEFGNLYGTSALKPVFKACFIKDAVLKAWGLCCERFGTPYRWAKTKAGTTTVGGVSIDNFAFIGKVLDSMGKSGSLVVSDTVEVGVEYAPGGIGQIFEAVVAYCNKMIYRGLGLPSLIADEGSSGSYSLGKSHFELWALEVEYVLNELLDAILEQLIRPLIEYNFPHIKDFGDFASAKLQVEDEVAIATIIATLAKAPGFLREDSIDDHNFWRERLGMPILEEGDLQPSLPEMPGLDQVVQAQGKMPPQKSFSLASRRLRRDTLRRTNLALFSQANTKARLPA